MPPTCVIFTKGTFLPFGGPRQQGEGGRVCTFNFRLLDVLSMNDTSSILKLIFNFKIELSSLRTNFPNFKI